MSVHTAFAVSGWPPNAWAIAARASAWSALRCVIAPAAAGVTGSGSAARDCSPVAESIRPYPLDLEQPEPEVAELEVEPGSGHRMQVGRPCCVIVGGGRSDTTGQCDPAS